MLVELPTDWFVGLVVVIALLFIVWLERLVTDWFDVTLFIFDDAELDILWLVALFNDAIAEDSDAWVLETIAVDRVVRAVVEELFALHCIIIPQVWVLSIAKKFLVIYQNYA